jgi:hypothetical protein
MSLLFEALRDLADMALGCKSCRARPSEQLGEPDGAERSFMGGLVYLSGGTTALHVGVLATPKDCSRLAGRLLGQVGEAHLPDSLVRGAMCELAYLLAGGVKRRLTFAGALSVGQPAYFAGAMEHRVGWDTRMTHDELDAMRATLISVARSDVGPLL